MRPSGGPAIVAAPRRPRVHWPSRRRLVTVVGGDGDNDASGGDLSPPAPPVPRLRPGRDRRGLRWSPKKSDWFAEAQMERPLRSRQELNTRGHRERTP